MCASGCLSRGALHADPELVKSVYHVPEHFVSESQQPDEMGEANEQPESAGGGGHPERAGVQLNQDALEAEPVQPAVAYQMSLFPTETEQIAYIDTAESVNPTPSAFSMFISVL